MSARDEYPVEHAEGGDVEMWERMCDELDRLRADNAEMRDLIGRAVPSTATFPPILDFLDRFRLVMNVK